MPAPPHRLRANLLNRAAGWTPAQCSSETSVRRFHFDVYDWLFDVTLDTVG
jgi:hypothetical protein